MLRSLSFKWVKIDMALPPHEQRHRFLRVQVFDFRGLPDLMAEGLSDMMSMEHQDDQGFRIYSTRDFLGTTPSYTMIWDPILRMCHSLIAHSIARRSQAPEKVTVTDLYYLRGMDVGPVNVPYLLARYLRLFADGRKSGAHISGGQFVARLAKHFGLLAAEILRGLTVIAIELPIIERQLEVTAGAPAEDAPAVDEGD
ncbi:hypothetical protein Tco_0319954 [Tanacetum coccineum]